MSSRDSADSTIWGSRWLMRRPTGCEYRSVPNTTRVGAESHREVFDEVEVVTQARVEHDVGRDLGDEEALARGLEAAEGIEGDHREVGKLTRDRRQLPQRLLGRVVHRVHQRDEADLAHPLEVAEDPLAVHRHTLEAGVEAQRDQPELIRGAVDLLERGRAVARFHDAARDGEPFGRGVAVRGDLVVDPPRVGDAVRAEIAVARDHECLVDATVVHDPQPALELRARELLRDRRSARRGHRRARRTRGRRGGGRRRRRRPVRSPLR